MSREDDVMKEGCAGDLWLCFLPFLQVTGCPWGGRRFFCTLFYPVRKSKCNGVFGGWDGMAWHGMGQACAMADLFPVLLPGKLWLPLANTVQGLLIHF